MCGGCLGAAFIGIAIVSGRFGELAPGMRAGLGIACFLLAFFGACRTLLAIKTHRIDISGNGQILLMETRSSAGTGPSPDRLDEAMKGEPVALSPDSTLWPFLLLLRLKAEHRSFTVSVLPDSMGRSDFKRLLVACRWIAARADSAG